MNTKEIESTHEKLREILRSYGNEEWGDCIIDEICFTFGYATTTDIEEKEEVKIPITFYQIKKVGWGKYCDVTGGNHYAINEGFSPKDSDIFYITEEQAKQLNFK